MSDALYERATELLEAEVGDELVALDEQEGSCFGFNEVATSVWRQLEQPKTFEDLKRSLLVQYEVSADQCTQELRELLDDLVERRLVRVQAGSGSPPTGAPRA
jgi:hypothetical protein